MGYPDPAVEHRRPGSHAGRPADRATQSVAAGSRRPARQAIGSAGGGQYGENAFRAALRYRPNLVEGHLALAELLLERGERVQASEHLQNALRLRPEIGEVLTAGIDETAVGAMVSGSGPSCLFLCTGREHAHQVAQGLRATRSSSALRLSTRRWPRLGRNAATTMRAERQAEQPAQDGR